MTIRKSHWVSILTTSLLFLGAVATFKTDRHIGVSFSTSAHAQSSDKGTIVEIATFKLKEGVSPAEFYAVDQAVEAQHVSQQAGFISRESAISDDREWLAIVHWRSIEDAEASMASFADAPATVEFMSKLDADSMVMKRYVHFKRE
ncbi:MAG: hypothetical protein AAF704_05985 [Cyanobacteria bacterium P01_D01_bin.123]